MKQTSKKKTAKKGSASKSAVKKNNTAPKKKEEDKKPDSSALIHQILPYIFGLLAIFVALCLILVNIAGKSCKTKY